MATIGHFARLPAADITLHFGPQGKLAHRLARGLDTTTVTPRRIPPTVARTLALDFVPLGSRQVSHTGRWLAGRVAEQLRAEYRGCRTLGVGLDLDSGQSLERERRLREPTADAAELRRLAEELLAEVTTSPPGASSAEAKGGVVGAGVGEDDERAPRAIQLTVTARDLTSQGGQQLDMFEASRRRKQALHQAIERLDTRYGKHIKRIVVGDEDAVLPGDRFRLEDYV